MLTLIPLLYQKNGAAKPEFQLLAEHVRKQKKTEVNLQEEIDAKLRKKQVPYTAEAAKHYREKFEDAEKGTPSQRLTAELLLYTSQFCDLKAKEAEILMAEEAEIPVPMAGFEYRNREFGNFIAQLKAGAYAGNTTESQYQTSILKSIGNGVDKKTVAKNFQDQADKRMEDLRKKGKTLGEAVSDVEKQRLEYIAQMYYYSALALASKPEPVALKKRQKTQIVVYPTLLTAKPKFP